MIDAARERLAETRRLIYQNLANGRPVAQVMVAFCMSEKEVVDHFHFVARKLFEYRFQRALPFVAGQTIAQATENRIALFTTLQKCGPVYLTSDFRVMRATSVKLEDKVATEKLAEIEARLEGR